MNRLFLLELLAALFILLFMYTACSKFLDFNQFQAVLRKSPLIGKQAGVMAWVIPAVEILLSILLFIPATRLAGLYCASGLMLLFTLYVGYMILFVPKLPCSCGGVLKEMTWAQHLVFNATFTLLALLGIRLHNSQNSVFGKNAYAHVKNILRKTGWLARKS